MEKDLATRVEALEKELHDLRKELNEIKYANAKANKVHIAGERNVEKEKPLTKYFFPEKIKEKSFDTAAASVESSVSGTQYPDFSDVAEKKPVEPPKPKKSFEETFLGFLPKIFMVIFVLGVLWGLKIASDYGFLSDGVKIVGGFVLAIALGAIAYWADRNEKLKESLVISLYGGAYIVGILTTAAGAILYEVLSLNVALVIALAFIAYGIAISYWKQKESLTVFVAFTSLLLPYLLDAMDFNPLMIAGYILLLAVALQVVIVKFKQKFALYISTFFAIIALLFLANTNINEQFVLAFAILVVFGLMLFGWQKIVEQTSKNYKAHIGLLFGFNFYALLSLVVIFNYDERAIIVSLVLLAIQGAFTAMAWKQKTRYVVDVTGAAIILTALYIILNVQVSDVVGMLFALVAAFVGLIVALRIQLPFMKFTYSAVFFFMSIGVYVTQAINKTFSIEHLLLLLVVVFYVAALQFAKKNQVTEGRYASLMKLVHIFEIVPITIFAFVWAYVLKLDEHFVLFGTYEYGGSLRVLADILLAVLVVATIILPRKWVGLWLPIFAFTFFVFKSVSVHGSSWEYDGKLFEQLLVRGIYIAVLAAIVLDLWEKGQIYRNFAHWIAGLLNWITVGIVLFALYIVFGTTDLLEMKDVISWNIAVMTNTVGIFVAAILSMMIGKRNEWKEVNYLGIGLLIFGFIKMIFFDLTELDISVRSILFIVIGAVGLVVSNRLMKK